MKSFSFLNFWLLLTVGLATVVFNSCGNDPIAVSGISLDKTALALGVGEDFTITATLTPSDATDKAVTWTSSDAAIATVTNGKVKAVAAGTATVTAKAGNETATCTVNIGIRINGIVWATRNVASPGTFAAKPEDAGMFYQWNRKVAWPATGNVTGWNNSMPTGVAWEKSNDPSPAGWHVPTFDDIQKLLDTEKVTDVWTTENGVSGRKFTDKATGKSIFLPAAGFRDGNDGNDGTLDNASSSGSYWSSTQNNESRAYYLVFNNEYAFWYFHSRRFGFSVRPVAD